MRCVLLRGACLQHARPVDHFDCFLVDIKVAASSHAINLSEALKRPERSFGGTTDSKASSFTDPVYQQGCLESPRKWRKANPDYWTAPGENGRGSFSLEAPFRRYDYAVECRLENQRSLSEESG